MSSIIPNSTKHDLPASYAVFWLGLAIITIALLFGGIHPISTDWPTPFASTLSLFAFGASSTIAALLWAVYCKEPYKHFLLPHQKAIFFGLVILLLSDFTQRRFGLITYAPLGYSSLVLAIPLALLPKRIIEIFLMAVAIAAPIVVSFAFLSQANGRLLFSDDHPAFLFRLIQLKQNFPSIPFYNPEWNAGVEAREFFPSGALNVFLLSFPLLYLFEPDAIYNYIVCIVLIFLPCVAAFSSSLIMGGPRLQHACAAVLGVLPTFLFYRWGLSYGTLGFIVAVSLAPICYALLCKLLKDRTLSIFYIALSVIVISLMSMWSLSVLTFVPVAILFLVWNSKVLIQPRILVMLAILAAINLPWMVVFLKASNVWKFVVKDRTEIAVVEENEVLQGDRELQDSNPQDQRFKPAPQNHPSKTALAKLREHAQSLNPALIFCGVPALLTLPYSWSLALGLSILWCCALGFMGSPFAAHLELERFYLFAGALLALPTARGFAHFLDSKNRYYALYRWAVVVCLLAPVLCTLAIIRKETPEPYFFAKPIVRELSDAIAKQSTSGRTMFAGFILHELSGGHVAPLAHWSDVPLMASRYQHDRWEYLDIIPNEFRERGEVGVLEFLNLNNVSEIVTHDRFWRKWYTERPHLFEKVWRSDRFTIFNYLKASNSYFLEGSGEVIDQSENSIILRLFTPTAVIKFNYLPFLRASNCSILGQDVTNSLQYIRLTGCPINTVIRIDGNPPWKRFL